VRSTSRDIGHEPFPRSDGLEGLADFLAQKQARAFLVRMRPPTVDFELRCATKGITPLTEACRPNRVSTMNDVRRAQLESLSIPREAGVGGDRRGVPVWVFIASVLAAVALAVLLTWALVRDTTPSTAAAPAVRDPTPETAPMSPDAAPVPLPRTTGLVASGYVTARRQATVSAEIAGRISEVLVEEGTPVEAGDILARLDDARAQLDLELIDAQIAAAEARVQSFDAQTREAAAVLARLERLLDLAYEVEASVTASRAQLQSLEAQLRAAQAELSTARVRRASQVDLVDRHVVRAPFAGVVIAKNAQVGEILSPASAGGGFTRTGIATLVDMASLEIEVDVNEGQIQRVRAGQPVEAILDAYPGWRIPARVEAIIPTADRSRATIRVRVAFVERDDRVLPDMAARVTFIES
jgi:HlyD family secretion protein